MLFVGFRAQSKNFQRLFCTRMYYNGHWKRNTKSVSAKCTFLNWIPDLRGENTELHSFLNPNKARGWDDISVRMIRICDDSLVFPLNLIFETCLQQVVFPEVWKGANFVPVHKKNSKNIKQNYRPISLLPIVGKMLQKLMFDSLYEHFHCINCQTLTNLVFTPEILLSINWYQ